MSRPLRDDDFTIDLTQGEKLIGTFYNIFRGNSNKNSHFPRIKIVFIPLRQNCGEKVIISRQNVLCGCQNNLSPTTFFPASCNVSSELQCLPRGDPKNLCTNSRIRLLATHSLKEKIISYLRNIDFINRTL